MNQTQQEIYNRWVSWLKEKDRLTRWNHLRERAGAPRLDLRKAATWMVITGNQSPRKLKEIVDYLE